MTPSPHALSRGNLARSTRTTSWPRLASRRAVVAPLGPAPTTTTSVSITGALSQNDAVPGVLQRTARRGPRGHDGSVNFLSGLHGAVALALLPALLFAEEAGVPLPFAPGELTLLFAGLLIASGGLNPYAFIPLALIACIAGSLVGYSWARAVGDRGLKG